MKRKLKKFETVYKNARLWALSRSSGSKLEEQKKYNTKASKYESLVYATFVQETQWIFFAKAEKNPSTWVFYQNHHKKTYDGKETLKSLCYGYFIEAEALYLANKAD